MEAEVAKLVAALKSPEVEVRQQAAEALCQAGPAARPASVELLDAAATDADDDVRDWASSALENLGPPEPAAVPHLARRLRDPHPDAAYWAATLLGRLGADAAGVVDRLAQALDEHRPLSVRQQAAWALGQIGPAARGAEAALQKAAQSGDPRLGRLARQASNAIAARGSEAGD